MIINTGMRTDIPAFYSEWFARRLKEGFVCTRNPYNPKQVTRYSLKPEVVDVIAFCSKNPAPMLKYMELLKPYGQYWFVTITPYEQDMEPNVPHYSEVVEAFKTLSSMVGVNSMGWRYDPILISEKYSIDRHLADFERIASALDGCTNTCVISYIDIYEKVRRNCPDLRAVSKSDRIELGSQLVAIANKHGMTVRPCAEGNELSRFGADCSGCMTRNTFELAIGGRLNVPASAAHSPRSQCACLLGKDIGEYDTCGHLCRYCYANSDSRAVKANMARHNPESPLLVGDLEPDDVIHNASQTSWAERQISLFDL